ncbi:MAG: threonylcarbamoyl-AMP synthase [Bacteroidia bacterium]|nr:MAG: threonylcarbamoyl-AMP synthase [Bacteroidia bacterium]
MDKSVIEKAVEVLRRGGILLYPTDTVWGLGCDACNEDAVRQLYTLKKRESNKSMLILLPDTERVYAYVSQVPEVALDVLDLAHTPTTVILYGAKNLASNLIAEDGSIGIRIPKNQDLQRLLKRFRRPIVSTSANISGEKSPTTWEEIKEEIKNSVDYTLPSNQTATQTVHKRPSSIIRIGLSGEIDVIRN